MATVASFHSALPAGHRVDAWRIDRVVATGATAVVYAATDVQLGTAVALKEYMPARLARREAGGDVLPLDAAAFERGLGAFVATARKLARCRQPALVPVLGFSLAHGTAYQAMPWIEGSSLRELRAAMPGPPDEATLRTLLGHLLDALAAVHATGSIHGDVHPGKVLLQRDDQAVLLGPGSLAREGAPLAPGAFVAPELSGEAGAGLPGPWSDLYAVAAVARFCIAGDGREAEVAPGRYSASLLGAIERALSPEASARPQSVAAFRAALAEPAAEPEPEPVVSTAEFEAERARIKRVVDSISFEDDDEELPRTDGLSRRSGPAAAPPSRAGRAPAAKPAAAPTAPRSRAAAIAAAVLAVVAALGIWALMRSPDPGDATPPASGAVTPAALPASAPSAVAARLPASAAKPSVEDSLAAAAAVLAAASRTPAASAPAAAPASAPALAAAPASAAVLAALSPSAAAVAAGPASAAAPPASAAARPRPVKRAAATPATAAKAPATKPAAAARKAPVVNPRASCAGRSDFALYRCMKAQCAQERWTAHPQCVRLRLTDRVDG